MDRVPMEKFDAFKSNLKKKKSTFLGKTGGGSNSNVFEDLNHLIKKSGYLKKRGGVHKTWRNRWFVLQGPFITYYADQDDETPKGVIVLDNCRITTRVEIQDREHCFMIANSDINREFYFQAASDAERAEWIDALREAIQWPQLLPSLVTKYEELQEEIERCSITLKNGLDAEDQLRDEVSQLESTVEENRAKTLLFNYKIEEKESEIASKERELDSLRQENDRLKAERSPSASLDPSAVALTEEIELLTQKHRDLAEKYNQKRVEREVLRKEVLRLKALVKQQES